MKRKEFKFSFPHQALSSNYHLVSHYPSRSLVREGGGNSDPTLPRTFTREFSKYKRRPSFVDRKGPPNDKRFDPSDFDPHVLSKCPRSPSYDLSKSPDRQI